MKRRLLILGMPIAVGSPWTAWAQTTGMPPATRPIRVIVPYPAGGRSTRRRGSLRAAWPIT